MENKANVDQYDEEIDLWELFVALWASKVLILVITTIFAIGSVFYALSIPNQYKAAALLAPAQSGGGGLSSALGQLGGLASFAGVSIGAGGVSESQIAQEIMQSWSFVETFIASNDLAVKVYAAEGWNKSSDELKINSELYDASNKTWLLTDEQGNPRPPDSWVLFQRFRGMVSIIEDKKSGLVTVSIEHYSPTVAKEVLDLYVAEINKHMQARQVAKVSNNIKYLEAQIARTSIAEMREVFYTIIEEQTKNKMVAEASPEYAFTAVSPSMIPQQKSSPNRAVICIFVTMLGGILGVLIAFIKYFFFVSSKT